MLKATLSCVLFIIEIDSMFRNVHVSLSNIQQTIPHLAHTVYGMY